MCGIFVAHGALHKAQLADYVRRCALLRHRGPDDEGVVWLEDPADGTACLLGHQRLAIIDVAHGKQPIAGCRTEPSYVVCNGEIYNAGAQRRWLSAKGHVWRTDSDSECVVHALEEAVEETADLSLAAVRVCRQLDGVFAFACWLNGRGLVVARDPIGVKPLYVAASQSSQTTVFASELKALHGLGDDYELGVFPAGHVWTSASGLVAYYEPDWLQPHLCLTEQPDLMAIRRCLVQATVKRMVADVPLGVLLSGGLDSSLLAAIAVRAGQQPRPIVSFAIGLSPHAPDLIAARKVAKYLNTVHHEVYFTVDEGMEAIRCFSEVVWYLETFEPALIRTAVPMFLLARYVRATGVKVLLSGEGADEIFGGYLSFHSAPSDDAFHRETISRVRSLHQLDCLRADKAAMANAVEVRVPFLDTAFLQLCMSICGQHKRPIGGVRPEKALLRQAFVDAANPWLPDDVLWRQKEQFDDGVGYGWADCLRRRYETQISDAELAMASTEFPLKTPKTKEALHIRRIFASHFPGHQAAATVHCWQPAAWHRGVDSSGRSCLAHVTAARKTS